MPFQRISTNRRLLNFSWPFVASMVLLMLLGWLSLSVLSAVRAFVGGESLWSKGQKDAIYYLAQYADTGSTEAYRLYQNAVRIPLNDKAARDALDLPTPDPAVAIQGFLGGGNDRADIPGMIWLYRHFRWISYMERAIQDWRQGDQLIAQLQALASRLHARRNAGPIGQVEEDAFTRQIQAINARATPLEQSFSDSLAEGARAVEWLLLSLNLLAAVALVLFTLARTRQLIRESQDYEEALAASEERLALAIDGSDYGIWDWDLASDRMYTSPRVQTLLGLTENDAVENFDNFIARLHPDDTGPTLGAIQRHLTLQAPYDVEYRLRLASGEYRWFRARGQALRRHGRPTRMSGSIFDITERKAAENALTAEKERAQVTLASIGDAVITTNTGGHIEYMNPVAEELTGSRYQDMRGRRLDELLSLADAEVPGGVLTLEDLLALPGPNSVGRDLQLVRPDGCQIDTRMMSAPIYDSSKEIAGMVLVFHDMTRERQYIDSLAWQATHDALTGLTNRHEFEQRLAQVLTNSANRFQHHALMYLDLDQFKVVNDTCGHDAGDELLCQVCLLLQEKLRESDTLARLGGDEFGVLLQNTSPEGAVHVAEKLRQTVLDLHFSWNGQPFSISVSIGLVHISGTPTTLKEVLRAADVACYLAKEKGRNRVQVHSPQDSELASRYGEMEWVHRLQRALEEDRFCLYAQKIVPVSSTGHAAPHFELLLRLQDEQGSLVPPIAFIPAAERYGMMPTIDRWVVRTALSTLAGQVSPGDRDWVCAINLSGASIGDESFLEFLRAAVLDSEMPPSCICFEITETSAIANLTSATRFVRELRKLGCRFSLDDFGAGMSSFGYLKHLPVDYLKIDGSFVKDMLDDPIDHAMVEVINHIGHVMDKQTIAEFVESPAMLEALHRIGVDYAQGYGVAKPQPLAELLAREFPRRDLFDEVSPPEPNGTTAEARR